MSPVITMRRTATRDTEIAGQPIRENDKVVMFYPSANRDADVFEKPEQFDVARPRTAHLAFGFGAHYCLGANLARLEAHVAVGTLLARTRSIERTDASELPLHPSPVFRAVTRLPVRLTPA